MDKWTNGLSSYLEFILSLLLSSVILCQASTSTLPTGSFTNECKICHYCICIAMPFSFPPKKTKENYQFYELPLMYSNPKPYCVLLLEILPELLPSMLFCKTTIIALVVHVAQAISVDITNYKYKSSYTDCSFNYSFQHASR